MASASSLLKSPKAEDDGENTIGSPVEERPKKKLRKLPDDVNKWPVDVQTEVLTGILRRKPVGLDSHFRMIALINDIFSPPSSTNSDTIGVSFQTQKHQSSIFDYDISSDDIWKYLNTCYDMDALNQTETPHPMSASGIKQAQADAGVETGDDVFFEFVLPEAEYGALIQSKLEQSAKTAALPNVAPASDSPPLTKKRKAKGGTTASGRQSAVVDDTESVSSSRSSTPASGGNTAPVAALTPITTPATRRSRQQRRE